MYEEKKSILRPNKIVAIIFYVVVLFLLSGIITIFIGEFLGKIRGLDMTKIYKSFLEIDLSEYELEYVKVNALAQGWGNFIGYFIACTGVVFFMRDDVVTDFKQLGEKKLFNGIYIPACAIAFVLLTYGVDILVGMAVDSSANQITIENIINNGGAAPMIIATVLFAPIVEELIYRKAIFSLCGQIFKKRVLLLSYILSTVIFTLPHVLTSDMSNFGIWLLQCVPYLVSAVLLCVIYHKSNYNIYSSIAAHMANNLFAAITIIIYQMGA